MNVTNLKKELKDVSSFGTLDYHLKLLLKEKLIEKNKLTTIQGQPTIYYKQRLKSKELKTSKEIYN